MDLINKITQKNYSDELLEMIRIDAMSMDLLSDSKRILDIYGHCGTSVFVAAMDGPPLPEYIENLTALNAEVKLFIALEMAKSIADLHGYRGGPIVHGDIQYLQWLFDENLNVILIDFNRAEPLLWDEESQTYCKYFVGGALGNVRSPEEYINEIVDEKIDVYSYGVAIYTMLTGKEPFWDDNIDIKEELLAGITPVIDIEIRNSSDTEAMLSRVIDECFEIDPEKRIDIFTVVSMLQDFFTTKFGSFDNVTIYDLGFEEIEFNDWDGEGDDEKVDAYYYYNTDEEVEQDSTSVHEELRL
jgi:serine/threonine protein kinase